MEIKTAVAPVCVELTHKSCGQHKTHKMYNYDCDECWVGGKNKVRGGTNEKREDQGGPLRPDS